MWKINWAAEKGANMATLFNNILEKKIKAALRAAKAAEKAARAAALKKAQDKKEALAAASAKNAAKFMRFVVEGFKNLLKQSQPAEKAMENTLWVAIHYGVFHADEVSAIALLRAAGFEVVVDRLNHQTPAEELEKYDLVVDLGRIYNPAKGRFDHHQDLAIEASNMLVLEWLRDLGKISEAQYREVLPLMKIISDGDRGQGGPRPADSVIELIAALNTDDLYGEAQMEAFEQAVEIMKGHLKRLFAVANKKETTQKTLAEKAREVAPGVLEMPKFLPFWNEVIFNLPELEGIDIVIWYDDVQGQWKAQQVPSASGAFTPKGRQLPSVEGGVEGAIFIHPGKFFVVFDSKKNLLAYIEKYAQ